MALKSTVGPNQLTFRGRRYYYWSGTDAWSHAGAVRMLKQFRERHPELNSIASHHYTQDGRDWWGIYWRSPGR